MAIVVHDSVLSLNVQLNLRSFLMSIAGVFSMWMVAKNICQRKFLKECKQRREKNLKTMPQEIRQNFLPNCAPRN